jgi:hypothetical protein
MTDVILTGTVTDALGLTASMPVTVTSTTADPWATLDGRANAPTGAPQYPTALNGYAVRPPWKVAGVDYRVGINTGVVLKPALTGTLPSGVSRNTTAHSFTITGSNVVLDSWDFSQNGGWNVGVTGANARITNCKFMCGANANPPIDSSSSATNIYIGYCDINGNGQDVGMGGLITDLGHGFTVEYCWIRNSGSDMMQKHGQGGAIVIRYNIVEQGGKLAGSHGDYTQILNGPSTAYIYFNFSQQTGGSTQGFMTEFLTEGSVKNNTLIGGCSYWTSVDISSLVTTMTMTDNYVDATAFGFRYPNATNSKLIYSGNKDLKTGNAIPA